MGEMHIIEGAEQEGTSDEEASGRTEAGATTSRWVGSDTEDTGAKCFANYRRPHHTDQREPCTDEVGGVGPWDGTRVGEASNPGPPNLGVLNLLESKRQKLARMSTLRLTLSQTAK